jgi:hypothetical protein
LKNRLQPGVVTLAGQLVHLQEAIVGTLLNLNQVRNLDGCRNFGKIKSLAKGIILRHSETPNFHAQPRAATNRGMSGASGAPGNSGFKKPEKQTCARGDKLSRRRQMRLLVLVDL